MMRFFRPTKKISVQDSQTRRQQQRQELLQHNAEQRKRAAKKEEARLRLQQQQQRQQQQREHLYQQQQQQQQRRQGEEMRQRQLQLMRNRRERQPRMLQYREQTVHENTEMQGLGSGLESGLQADRAAIARIQHQIQLEQRQHPQRNRHNGIRGGNSTAVAVAALRRRQSELIRHQRQRRIQRELDQQQRQPGRQLSFRERIAQSLIFFLSDSRIASSTKPELSAPVVESFSEKNDDVDQSFDPLLLTDCSICLEDYQSGELLCATKVTACPHVFHYHCIKDWLKEHDDCPLCRTNLL